MRRLLKSGLFLGLLCALVAGGHNALAQSAPDGQPDLGAPSSTLPILLSYRLPLSVLPDGASATKESEVSNVVLAAGLRDPSEIQAIVQRGRTDGYRQSFELTGQGIRIDLALDLFRDSQGAQADLPDTGLTGVVLTPEPAPPIGDTGLALRYSQPGSPDESVEMLGFTADRLELNLNASGPSAAISQATLLPLATYLATQIASQPIPPPSADELSLLQTQTSSESSLHDAYQLLLNGYLTRLSPVDVLTDAYNGALKALPARINTSTATLPITAGDLEGAWAQFLPAYQSLEAAAGLQNVSQRDLAYAAAAGMYDPLNCHTAFFPPNLYNLVYSVDSGSGQPAAVLGLDATPSAPFTVLRVRAGSPADGAGVRPGDQILAINHIMPAQVGDKAFGHLTVGNVGTNLTLTVRRPGVTRAFDLTAVLALGGLPLEQHRILPGGIGYVDLEEFPPGGAAVREVRDALDSFDTTGNVGGWILDLRYNSGGTTGSLARVAGLFLPPGSMLETVTTQDGTQQTVRAQGTPVADQQPLVILVGPATESAAELFAEALRDQGRATIVGSQTAGCVNGGQIFGLLDGSGAFVSEINVLAGPNLVSLEGTGVTPDQTVPLTSNDLAAGRDPQLAAAEALLGTSSPPQP